jgi:hypothetical protein
MRIGLQAWGSEGDIQPFTALAAGLVKAGHELTLVVTDNIGRDYSGLAKRLTLRPDACQTICHWTWTRSWQEAIHPCTLPLGA